MKRGKRLVSGLLSGILAVAMVTPALAATNTESVIDTNRKGTLNIHKIVENDGTLLNADGLAMDLDNVQVDNIGFDYVKIADIENVTGIIVSKDGDVVLNPTNSEGLSGEVQVGTYFVPNDMMEELMAAANVIPAPTYILTDAVNSPNGTLQHEFNDDSANSLLSAEQAAVDSAESALNTAKANLKAAQNVYSAAVSGADTAAANLARLQAAATAAQSAYDDADDAATDAAAALAQATSDAATLAQAASDASDAYDEAADDAQAALDAYAGDPSTMTALQDAIDDLRDAADALKSASDNAAIAQAEADEAASNLANANAALAAAQEILRN